VEELARPDAVVVQRTVDADIPTLTDELTSFALTYGLQLDRRHGGDGMKFVRKREAETADKELFRSGDELLVVLTPDGARTDVVLTATMAGLHQRGEEWKRGRTVRGALLSGLFAYLGVRGLADPGVGDAVMFGLSALFLRRTFRAVHHEADDRAAFEDDVHEALAELAARMDEAD
jgi:hypothetical protein